MTTTARSVLTTLGAFPEVLLVLAGAALGLGVRSPFVWMGSHDSIDVLLAVLMFATALGIDPSRFARLHESWPTLLAAVAVGIVLLPFLSWLAAQLVVAPLRDGVITAGLAPCEIASVATTAMADGDTALSAGILGCSTLATVVLAVPILSIESAHAHLHPAAIIVNLAAVVALPFVLGILLRLWLPSVGRAKGELNVIAIVTVAVLVAVIAAEVHLSIGYLSAGLALALFIAASAVLGRILAVGASPAKRRSLLLTTSMRDFAVAAAIATAAFGPAAAAPLGLYGILVLAWGTAAAGVLRRGHPPANASEQA